MAIKAVIWPMRTRGLVTAGECGSRQDAVHNVCEKKESGTGPMSNKNLHAEGQRKILCTHS
jgi:hypothetical protein